MKNDILYKILNKREKIWITEDFGISLIKRVHVELGHIGTEQLALIIGHKFYFKNMYKHIKLIRRSCDVCVKNESRIGCFKSPLSHLGPAKNAFEIISLDTIVGFTNNRSSKKYLHLIIDHFTRYAYICTSKTQIASSFIKLVKKVQVDGKIKTLLTDQYPGINSDQFKNFFKSQNIKLIFTGADCAFSNGLNETSNQT